MRGCAGCGSDIAAPLDVEIPRPPAPGWHSGPLGVPPDEWRAWGRVPGVPRQYFTQMRAELAFDDGSGELVVSVSGRASIGGFERVIADILEHAKFRPGLLILFDDTHLDLKAFATNDVRAVAALTERVAGTLAPRAVAVVVPSPLAFGLARQWAAFAEPAGMNTAVFATHAEAFTWLRSQAAPAAPAP